MRDQLNRHLQQLLESRSVQSDDGQRFDLSSEISAAEGNALADLIKRTNAKTTLEVGLAYGISALFICEALTSNGGSRHIAMDPNQSLAYHRIGLKNLHDAGYDSLVEFYEESSHVVLPRLEQSGAAVDFAFIDASHMFDYTLLEFFYIDRMLKPGGIIAFDDVSMPAVLRVCRFVLTNRKYRVVFSLPETPTTRSRLKQKVVGALARVVPFGSRVFSRELRVANDTALGLVPGCRFVAIEKMASDESRAWNFFVEF